MTDVLVRPVELKDRPLWDVLWKGYTEFYQSTVSQDVTECLWQRLHDPASPIKGIVSMADNQVAGIGHYVLSLNTWGTQPICYLEDLYVDPAHRGKGHAHAIIKWLWHEAKEKGWTRVYWMTRASNLEAQKLYDRIAQRTDWIRYDLNLSRPLSS